MRQGANIDRGRARRFAFNVAVKSQNIASERRNLCAASALATGSGFDRWGFQTTVHLFDQEPRATIRHTEPASGGRNRSRVEDRLQQIDFTGTDRYDDASH